MTVLKKITAFLLVMLSLFSVTSCTKQENNRDYDPSEVEAAAEELINKSFILNEILYGKGIGFIPDDSSIIYKKADEKSLLEFGISSIDDLKNKISEVFSEKYIESIEKSDIFTALLDGEVTVSHTRYFEDGEGEDKVFYVNSVYNYALKNPYEYISDVKAIRSEGEFVIVSAAVRATREDGKVRDFDHEIRLIEEDAGWRLASQTYVVYNEYTDIYEDMNK